MYVRGDLMIIIGGGFSGTPSNWEFHNGGWMSWNSWHSRVIIRIYNIADTANPVLEQYYEIDGNFHTSRVQEDAETLFFVVNYWPHIWQYDNNVWQREIRQPYFRTSPDGQFTPLCADDMFYFDNCPNRSFMILGRIELNSPEAEPLIKAYLNNPGVIYVSGNYLYSSNSQLFYNWHGGIRTQRSYIARFCLADLSYAGYATVLGLPPDRHAISEYNGYLRVATTLGLWWANRTFPDVDNLSSNIFVFNGDLEEVSRITNIAPREQMDSAAFDGSFGYISTSPPWLIYDPLYTVDLTNPYKPTISEGLETDGVNDYMKAIAGTPFAIGIGRDSDEGGSAWQTGIKIELYDMKPGTGETPESLVKHSIFGRGGFSEVLWNPRALLYFMYDEDNKRGFIGFAAESRDWGRFGDDFSDWHSHTFAQGFYLFRFDGIAGTLDFLGTQRTVTEKGTATVDEREITILLPPLSNFDTSQNVFPLAKEENWNWQDSWQAQLAAYSQFITRAVVNQGFIYTVSGNVIAGYCLVTLDWIDEYIGN